MLEDEIKMGKWIEKSKLPRELLLFKIREETYSYNFSNIIYKKNTILAQVNSSNLYLYYTGKNWMSQSIYWAHIVVEIKNGTSFLMIKLELRPEIKTLYFLIPLMIWLFVAICLFKNIWMLCILEIIQSILSIFIILLMKNIGRKKQIFEVLKFLREKELVE